MKYIPIILIALMLAVVLVMGTKNAIPTLKDNHFVCVNEICLDNECEIFLTSKLVSISENDGKIEITTINRTCNVQ